MVGGRHSSIQNIYSLTFPRLSCVYQVVFDGEEGLDFKGVKKEFFMLLFQEILNPDFGMFYEDDESHFIWFRDQVRQTVQYPSMHWVGLLD